MAELMTLAFLPINLVFTLLLLMVILYWIIVILGVLDVDLFRVDFTDFDADGDLVNYCLCGYDHFLDNGARDDLDDLRLVECDKYVLLDIGCIVATANNRHLVRTANCKSASGYYTITISVCGSGPARWYMRDPDGYAADRSTAFVGDNDAD